VTADRDAARRRAKAIVSRLLDEQFDRAEREALSGPVLLEVHCPRGTPQAVHAVRLADRRVEKVGE
jgi:hypothetical protein